MGGGLLLAMCTSHLSVGGCPVCGCLSCVGDASSLYMGGASLSMGYHGHVWGHIAVCGGGLLWELGGCSVHGWW